MDEEKMPQRPTIKLPGWMKVVVAAITPMVICPIIGAITRINKDATIVVSLILAVALAICVTILVWQQADQNNY